MIILYRVLTSCLFCLVFPPVMLIRFLGMKNEEISQRVGLYGTGLSETKNRVTRIWIHAASVGEVKVAENILRELTATAPDLEIVISTTTRTGQALAREKFGTSVTCVLAPLDFSFCIKQALDRFQPDMVVFVETEIWPNWLYISAKKKVPAVFVNGRISHRSIRKYLIMKPLFAPLLAQVKGFSMISRDDAGRICRMGAPENRVVVNGNAKFDGPDTGADTCKSDPYHLMNLKQGCPVFVAGCTRPSEEEKILDVYDKVRENFPDLLLIIAPRHVERTGRIEQLITAKGYPYQLRTDLDKQERTSPVVIIDTIGELQDIYSIADVVFCGGSLAPFGGHNILEPAAWGKPVLYGPYMDDFRDAAALLENAGGGSQVDNVDALLRKVLFLLSSPDKAREMGRAAKDAVISNKGAAGKHAEVILEILKKQWES